MKALPGSLLPDGAVVDWTGKAVGAYGTPIFIPTDIRPERKRLLGLHGWFKCPARDWPSVLPRQGLACIVRYATGGFVKGGRPYIVGEQPNIEYVPRGYGMTRALPPVPKRD